MGRILWLVLINLIAKREEWIETCCGSRLQVDVGRFARVVLLKVPLCAGKCDAFSHGKSKAIKLILSSRTLRMTITHQVRMEASIQGGAIEIIRVGAGDTVKTYAGIGS